MMILRIRKRNVGEGVGNDENEKKVGNESTRDDPDRLAATMTLLPRTNVDNVDGARKGVERTMIGSDLAEKTIVEELTKG